MKIYDIKSEYFALQELIESEEINEETGEFIDNSKEIQELLDGLENARDDKLVNIEHIKQEMLNHIEAIKAEKSRLSERQKGFLNKIESLKNLQTYLLDGDKVETDIYTFGFRKSSQVEIIDETLVDSKYLKQKITYTVDKALIKAHIKAGEDVVGAELIDKQNLSVR